MLTFKSFFFFHSLFKVLVIWTFKESDVLVCVFFFFVDGELQVDIILLNYSFPMWMMLKVVL